MKSPPRPQEETPAEATEARLRLYNTLTRRKDRFAPIDPSAVRLYVCGPTVYDFAHIGNARPVIVFDVLFRLLRHLYGDDQVIYTRNITDVDDKINARAERDFPALPLNEAIAKVTEATEQQFRGDVSALGALAPTHEPRATQYIDTMRVMIERLIARSVAYVAEDHVLFSPNEMDARPGAPRYGTLAHRSLDEMLAGARVEVAPYKRDPMDFVLWKPSKANEPGWPSPAGIGAPGRPGWHIECSAMSFAKLIEPFASRFKSDDPNRDVFDIHGGGIDLVFPHHENEIAQSCCAFGSKRMANVWMHNGFLQVEGEKMSKSLGNFVTIHELLHTTRFGGRKWPGEVLRLAMLRTHYRQPIDWTVKALEEAEATLDRWYEVVGDVEAGGEPDHSVLRALYDDLNTHDALVRMHELAKLGDREALRASLTFLGFAGNPKKLTGRVSATAQAQGAASATGVGNVEVRLDVTEAPDRIALEGEATDAWNSNRIFQMIARRTAARIERNFAEADKIRDELASIGVVLKDEKDGATTFEIKG